MPELPDVIIYIDALRTRLVGAALIRLNLLSPFVLRSVEPPLESIRGAIVRDVFRVGKRIVQGIRERGPQRGSRAGDPERGWGPATIKKSRHRASHRN